MSAAKANGTWPTVRIGEVLRLRAPDVAVEPTQSYQFAGVYCFGRGVFRGQEKQGAEFAYRKLTRVRAGEFVYPKLMAWEGAFGVVPMECDGCHLSPEFPVFEVNSERVLPRFLGLHFQRPTVWAAVSGGSTGTNMRRRRLNPTDFLRREIPLPSLAEQRRIAEHLDTVAARVARVRAALTDNEADLERLLQQEFAALIATAPRRRMKEVAPLVRRLVNVEVDVEYLELGVRSFGRGTFHKPPLTGADLGGKRVFRIEPGDLVFMNVFAWEGAIAVARPEDAGRVGSHRFITCVPVPDLVTANFLRFYLLSPEGLERVRAGSPGSAGRNRTLGITALMDIAVPIPTLERQQWFDMLCAKAATLRAHYEAHRADLAALHPSLLDQAFKGDL